MHDSKTQILAYNMQGCKNTRSERIPMSWIGARARNYADTDDIYFKF